MDDLMRRENAEFMRRILSNYISNLSEEELLALYDRIASAIINNTLAQAMRKTLKDF